MGSGGKVVEVHYHLRAKEDREDLLQKFLMEKFKKPANQRIQQLAKERAPVAGLDRNAVDIKMESEPVENSTPDKSTISPRHRFALVLFS